MSRLVVCVLLVATAFAATCRASAADTAIAWEAEQFREHSAPYAGLCLGFVKDAYAAAGISGKAYMDAGSAKDGAGIAKGLGGWHGFSSAGAVPRGALVFWPGCSSNGHVALATGGGGASSSGDGSKWNGSPNTTIDWLSEHWCGGNPAGWIVPS
eukprot:ANDGO_01098.mRNA.1 hypothetical protein